MGASVTPTDWRMLLSCSRVLVSVIWNPLEEGRRGNSGMPSVVLLLVVTAESGVLSLLTGHSQLGVVAVGVTVVSLEVVVVTG